MRNVQRDLGERVTVSSTSLARTASIRLCFRFLSCPEFVQTYADLARKRRETYAVLDREVGLLRSMLWINFRVRLAFDVGPLPPPFEEQSELVAQLHDAITSVGASGARWSIDWC